MHLLFILFFAFAPNASSHAVPIDECAMNLSYKMTEQSNGKALITLQVEGGTEPFHYFFFNAKNVPMTWEFTSNSYLVEHGEYPKYAKARDADGCIKMIEIKESK